MQQEYFGFGSLSKLEDILKKEGIRKVFLVTGKGSFESCGAKERLPCIFEKTGCDFTRFYDFSSSPKLEEIEKGFDLFQNESYDCIIGIGGGSSIDVAKSIKLSNYDERGRIVPLVAIPTTSGSGSEATYFIVCYKDKEKQSQGHPEITLPDYAILDPGLTIYLPRRIIASTGMDALSQAIESYWNISSTDESKEYSIESIRLIMQNLERNANNPFEESRTNMMRAANLAGKAINITRTTACHSVSYPITSYFEIPHGHAVALTLGEMLVYNSKCENETCNDERGAGYVRKTINEIVGMLGAKNADESYTMINNLMKSIGLETRLSDLGIGKEGIEIIINNGFTPERVKNNPRVLTKENLRKILERIN